MGEYGKLMNDCETNVAFGTKFMFFLVGASFIPTTKGLEVAILTVNPNHTVFV